MEKMPCETIVWDSLPAIRAALAAEMIKQGFSQTMVARCLNMAPSAVSQYLSGKRGYRIVFSQKVSETIASLAHDLINGDVKDPRDRICKICSLMRGNEDQCPICGE